METVERGTSFFEAFRIADDILRQAVQGISDIITVPGIINRDFADVKTIMHGQGYAVMGTAVATGTNRAVDAANRAIASPLLEDNSIQGAQGILINISGSSSLTLQEVHEASCVIQKAAHENANIIFGAVQDDDMKDTIKITVIAAGFKDANKKNAHQRPSSWRKRGKPRRKCRNRRFPSPCRKKPRHRRPRRSCITCRCSSPCVKSATKYRSTTWTSQHSCAARPKKPAHKETKHDYNSQKYKKGRGRPRPFFRVFQSADSAPAIPKPADVSRVSCG